MISDDELMVLLKELGYSRRKIDRAFSGLEKYRNLQNQKRREKFEKILKDKRLPKDMRDFIKDINRLVWDHPEFKRKT